MVKYFFLRNFRSKSLWLVLVIYLFLSGVLFCNCFTISLQKLKATVFHDVGLQTKTITLFVQGQFINEGLWKVVQYPNYLGEIMMWSGLYLTSTSVLKGWEHIAVISPIFLTYLLTNLSGIPLQEKSAMRRYGSNPDYLQHIKNTKKLIPFIWWTQMGWKTFIHCFCK